jgi:mono/diheme cytochrome c family protein
MCGQCHTPHDSLGRPDQTKRLEGAALWLQPSQPTADWPQQAPRLAGNPPETDAELVRLLTTGISRDNKPPRAPMPQFRMTVEDAKAVITYLRSLGQ